MAKLSKAAVADTATPPPKEWKVKTLCKDKVLSEMKEPKDQEKEGTKTAEQKKDLCLKWCKNESTSLNGSCCHAVIE